MAYVKPHYRITKTGKRSYIPGYETKRMKRQTDGGGWGVSGVAKELPETRLRFINKCFRAGEK